MRLLKDHANPGPVIIDEVHPPRLVQQPGEMLRSTVVLPHPDGPRKQMKSRGQTSKEISSSA